MLRKLEGCLEKWKGARKRQKGMVQFSNNYALKIPRKLSFFPHPVRRPAYCKLVKCSFHPFSVSIFETNFETNLEKERLIHLLL